MRNLTALVMPMRRLRNRTSPRLERTQHRSTRLCDEGFASSNRVVPIHIDKHLRQNSPSGAFKEAQVQAMLPTVRRRSFETRICA
jgi:hypothetical protein